MDRKIINEIDSQVERILKDSLSGDLKLLLKWSKTLSMSLSKEIKNTERDKKVMEKYSTLLIDIIDNFIYLLRSDEDESSIYLGPQIFEALMKAKESLMEYYLFMESLETNSEFRLSPEQLKSLERIERLNLV